MHVPRLILIVCREETAEKIRKINGAEREYLSCLIYELKRNVHSLSVCDCSTTILWVPCFFECDRV